MWTHQHSLRNADTHTVIHSHTDARLCTLRTFAHSHSHLDTKIWYTQTYSGTSWHTDSCTHRTDSRRCTPLHMQSCSLEEKQGHLLSQHANSMSCRLTLSFQHTLVHTETYTKHTHGCTLRYAHTNRLTYMHEVSHTKTHSQCPRPNESTAPLENCPLSVPQGPSAWVLENCGPECDFLHPVTVLDTLGQQKPSWTAVLRTWTDLSIPWSRASVVQCPFSRSVSWPLCHNLSRRCSIAIKTEQDLQDLHD